MRNLYLTLAVVLYAATLTNAQTVTTYAGVENITNPETNVDNSQVSISQAHFYEPQGIGWDSDGNMYTTERNKIRIIQGTTIYNRSGSLGDASFSLGYKNGTGNAAAYFNPTSIVCDANRDAYIVDSENHAIRKLSKFGTISTGQIASTFAGAAPSGGFGTSGSANGTGTSARFNSPKGIAIASNGNFYVTDFANHTIREITSGAVVSTLAGQAGTSGSADGSSGSSSTFNLPYGIAVYDQNNIVITDFGNTCIRMVNINTGATTTITGAPGSFSSKDGTLAEARFRSPKGIAVVDGLIFVADENLVRIIDINGDSVSTFAGDPSSTANKDGVGENASFGRLSELSYDGGFTLYVTDVYYNVVKAITVDNLMPVADFTASKKSLEVNENTILTDISAGATVTARTWTIKDVSGSTANVEIVSGDPNASESLTVRFKATGFYTVTLSITNDFGSDQVTKTDYINVSVTGNVTRLSDEQLLQIYPNPSSSDHVTISSELLNQSGSSMRVLNMQGQVIDQYDNIRSRNLTIPVSGYIPGVYFIEMETERGVLSKKLIIR